MARKKVNITVIRHTENGGYLKTAVNVFSGEAEFSGSYRFCYLPNLTLEKIKGGCGRGNSGTHLGVEDGEVYTFIRNKT